MQAGSRASNSVIYSRYEFSIPLCTFRASLNVGKTVLKRLPVTWGDNGVTCRSPRAGRVSPPRVQTSGLAQLEKLHTQLPEWRDQALWTLKVAWATGGKWHLQAPTERQPLGKVFFFCWALLVPGQSQPGPLVVRGLYAGWVGSRKEQSSSPHGSRTHDQKDIKLP